VRRNGKPLHLHSLDDVGVVLILGIVGEFLVLRTEETRRIRPVRLVEIAGPEIIGLHHVEIAVEDQITLACHFHLRGVFSVSTYRSRPRYRPQSSGRSQLRRIGDDLH
jgi:hypothetical protein